jgi:thioredoxin 2
LKLNADTASDLTARLGITGIPTLLLMRDGQEISRSPGAMDLSRILAWTEDALART